MFGRPKPYEQVIRLAALSPAGGYGGKEIWVAKSLGEHTYMLGGEFERVGPRLEDIGDFAFFVKDGFEGHRLVDEDESVNKQFYKDIGTMKIKDI